MSIMKTMYDKFKLVKCSMGDVNESYWFVNSKNRFCWADNLEDFETGSYYEEDMLDDKGNKVKSYYKFEEYIGAIFRLPGTERMMFEVFKLENEINPDDYDIAIYNKITFIKFK